MNRAHNPARPARGRDNFEFLPAALEVLEAPPAPFGRIIAIVLAVFFAIAVLWAWLGSVDVVAVLQGQTIPAGRVKIVQPFEPGIVRAIHVKDGQFVEKGDLLIELDPTEAIANIDALYVDLMQARLDAASNAALLDDGHAEGFTPPADANPKLVTITRNLLSDQLSRHRAATRAIESEILGIKAVLRSLDVEQGKLRQTLPLIEERLEDQKGLLEKEIGHKSAVLALRQELFEQRAALAKISETRAQYIANIQTLRARHATLVAEFRTTAGEQRRDAERRIAVIEQSLKKELQRRRYRELRASVSGMVHQLAIHTIGAVVNSAEKLLVVVPKDAPLEIEAMILNKDIGFIEVEQPVEVKLEAFPFTRYGTLTGKMLSISDDAIIHEQLGPVYKARVALDTQHIRIDGKAVDLSPGMNVTVEVKTGRRQVIEFFLSPIMRYKDEAIRER